jgi:hypothetical protein
MRYWISVYTYLWCCLANDRIERAAIEHLQFEFLQFVDRWICNDYGFGALSNSDSAHWYWRFELDKHLQHISRNVGDDVAGVFCW